MNTPDTNTTAVKSTASPQPTNAKPAPVKGADIIVRCLERAGVDVVFGYPGGASIEIHQALTRSDRIRVIVPRHEQGEVFAAEGYARASGRPGVCLATSGPGATNLVTGIADAYMDSIPLIAVTGQVNQTMIGKTAFQEMDVVGTTMPMVKHSYLVLDINELPQVFAEAFYVATTGRPGPVLIDIPKDVQQATTIPDYPDTITLPGYRPDSWKQDIEVIKSDLDRIAEMIEAASRPVIYCGGGIISAEASDALKQFARKANIPVTTTLMGVGAIPQDDPLSLMWLGMHGTVFANYAVAHADLLLALGVRFDDRVTGKVEKFCEHGKIVHVDIDNSEFNKNRLVDIAIQADVRWVIEELIGRVSFAERKPWHDQLNHWKQQYPMSYHRLEDHIQPQMVIEELSNLTAGEAIITTGVGQHQMWTGQFYNFQKPRTYITSAGLGSMGFGLPSAIGAQVGMPDTLVVNIDGDGSFAMNIQELATTVIEQIPVKSIILNNQHLGMVMQWEDRFYDSNRGHTYIGNPSNPSRPYPDFVKIAEGYGVAGKQIHRPEEVVPALKEMIETPGPYVLDVIVPYTEHVLPMIPAGKTWRDIIVE
ncbi:MAG: biosynthetic-type acetolactate synthase large subunit [Verrucomicrobiota bacterium]|jgi:acetolactate synthase-1/2/3 large subunit|nr:biosynthetic-type acetolactate synthase large subunit [Verrucomicrobiota bacterium]MDD8050124.1 biosynthetic-type acetolactate synthase large subunit [Verrucomicrobiota bacterium]MDI9382832.1 biosynthetic-type acetolactate synthase large subunit [Verrucomicrobiota bacterium]HCF96846.1 biosynthetic-type acetolactate synthase large subunit [Verrucomicrobiota bacterium]